MWLAIAAPSRRASGISNGRVPCQLKHSKTQTLKPYPRTPPSRRVRYLILIIIAILRFQRISTESPSHNLSICSP